MFEDFFELIDSKTRKYAARYSDKLALVCLKFIVFFISKFLKIIFNQKIKIKKSHNYIKIGIYMSGGLGDALINLNYLYKFREYIGYKDINIDVYFEKPIFAKFVRENDFINKYYIGRIYNIDDYDVFFRIFRYPCLYKFNREFVKNKSKKLYDLLEKYAEFKKEHGKVVLQEPWYDSIGKDIALANNHIRLQQPDIDNVLKITENYELPIEISNIDKTLRKFSLDGKKFITLNRGVGNKLEQSPKLWPLENYNLLIKLLKESYPNYTLVQLGDTASTFGIMQGIDLNLVGQTSFDELVVLLKTADLHIDCEGGLVHLRKALNAPPSVVLFGPTSLEFFGYPTNINIKAENVCKIACEWVSTAWETTCIKTNSAKNPCMHAIRPEMVMSRIKEVLSDKNIS